MSHAWFNCHAGVAGDMTLAALVDAGADQDVVANTIAGLGVDGYALVFERVQRCGVGATWANVVVHNHDQDHGEGDGDGGDLGDGAKAPDAHTHRPAREIFALLAAADLPARVRTRATAVFERLAAVEGAVHGIDPADVELHEVGALDSIIDVVGVCAALESLDVTEIRCSSIGLGSGTISTAHGQLVHPAPATIALLTAAGAPMHGVETTLETATPTGAALMTTLASGFGPLSPGTPTAVGYGAGTADPADRANLVQVVISDATSPARDGDRSQDGVEVMLLEANLDDVSGEVLAHTVDALLAAGAHDAWVTPIVMKKGRPAHTISVLGDPADTSRLRALLVRESGTLGVRGSTIRKWPQQRSTITVDVDGHAVGVKLSEYRIKVEFNDAASAARGLDLPVRVVIERAVALAEASR